MLRPVTSFFGTDSAAAGVCFRRRNLAARAA
jgi:hypothetical protein